MNKERILELADLIEQTKGIEPIGVFDAGRMASIEPIGVFDAGRMAPIKAFEMDSFKCGTGGCICGWAVQRYDPDQLPILVGTGDSDLWVEAGAAILGLGIRTAGDLFLPSDFPLAAVTTDDAVLVLHKLAETGKVDWSHVGVDDDDGPAF